MSRKFRKKATKKKTMRKYYFEKYYKRGLSKSNIDTLVQAFYIRHMKEERALCARCLELASTSYSEAYYLVGSPVYNRYIGTTASSYCLVGNCRDHAW